MSRLDQLTLSEDNDNKEFYKNNEYVNNDNDKSKPDNDNNNIASVPMSMKLFITFFYFLYVGVESGYAGM